MPAAATRRRSRLIISIALPLLIAHPGMLTAETGQWRNCVLTDTLEQHRQNLPFFDVSSREKTMISADRTRSDMSGLTSFAGNVIIEKHLLRLSADEAGYDKQQDYVSISGNVEVMTENMSIQAGHGEVTLDTNQGKFSDTRFFLPASRMRGAASLITSGDSRETELTDASITTCEPDDVDWQLSAGKISLDHEEEYGTASDVVLRFMDVPFFYTPYIEFPVGDRRRSGLLVPEITNSSSRGFELTVPWYWNIAPNHDAILAPHYMRKRGTQLDTQYRFLTRSSKGQLDSAYLHDDKMTQDNRYLTRYQQRSSITDGLTFHADINDVSDTDYFLDFSNNLTDSSTTHLNRNVNLKYNVNNWQASITARSYETVDSTIALSSRPYRTLPKINLNGEHHVNNSGFAITLNTDWTDFDHEDNNVTTGARTLFEPGIVWRLSGTSWFIIPATQFSYTEYDVEDGSGAGLDLAERKLSRNSLDAGLFFERSLDNGLIQTLEPRLYYLNVPFRDQTGLPVFDTSIPDFSFAQMFRNNRFNGSDRIGDANQATFALTSRLINAATGDEMLRASIGQIMYFEDRQVTLSGVAETSRDSDIIAEIGGSKGHWSARGSIQWDTEIHRGEKENFIVGYQSDNKHILNLGYRKRESGLSSDLEQSDISFVFPLDNQYTFFGRWNYSIPDNRDIDVIAGIEYDSCCWSVQILAQRHLQNSIAVDEYDNSIMVQLVLKGLGSVSGSSASNTLEHAIRGYHSD